MTLLLRSLWAGGSQALSSVLGFAVALLVLRAASPVEFGGFSLALGAYVVALTVSRSVVSTPLLLERGGGSSADVRGSLGAAVAVGLVGLVACVATAAFVPPAVAAPLRGIGLLLPLALLHDAYRYVMLSGGRPQRAAGLDAVALIATLVAYAGLSATSDGALLAVTAWTAGLAASCAVGAVSSGAVPGPGDAVRFVRRRRALTASLGAEALAVVGVAQLSLVAISVVLTIEALGQLRAAFTLLAPVTTLHSGLLPVLLTTLRDQPAHRRPRTAVAAVSVSAAAALLVGAACALLPSGTLASVLGETAVAGQQVVMPVAMSVAAGLALGAAVTSLRFDVPPAQVAAARVAATVTEAAASLVAAHGAGVVGAAVGSAAASSAATVTALLRLQRGQAPARG